MQVTALRNRKKVEFVVGDPGIGIPTSLKSGHREISSDVDALSRAIQEGVTRDKALGQGNGLYGSYRISTASAGSFSIHSNFATLYYAESSGMHSKLETIPFQGSLVTCGIDYTNDLLLEQALRFRDTPFNPVDRVELKYETQEEGDIMFHLAAETVSVGSRIAGIPVRNKLRNLLLVSDAKQIIVDLQGIPIVSSSFADEVFGKMFMEIGPVDFMSRLHLIHVDPTVRNLIDKAIMQRVTAAANRLA